MKCTDNTARQLLWLLSPEQQHTVTGFLVSCAAKLPEIPAPYPPLNSFNVHCKRTFSLRILTVHTVLVHLQPFSLHLLATSLFFLFRIPIPSVLFTIYPFPLCIFYILKIINLLLVISTRCFFFILPYFVCCPCFSQLMSRAEGVWGREEGVDCWRLSLPSCAFDWVGRLHYW